MKRAIGKLRLKISKYNDNDPKAPPSKPVPIVPQDPLSIGLKMIYDSPDATIDIIAIHGQNGHPINSWTNRDNGVLWLRDLLPGILETHPGVKIRVLSYGYGRRDPVEVIGAGLMKSIGDLRTETKSEGRKIIWCAHSFGGPLLRAAITIAPPSSDIQVSTHAILFFGVAKNMGLENLSTVLAMPEATLSSEMKELRKEMMWLKMGIERFDPLGEHLGWNIVWFREVGSEEEKVRHSDGVGGNEDLGEDGEGKLEVVVRLEKTHGAMVRFADVEDEDFIVVVEKTRNMVEEITKSISASDVVFNYLMMKAHRLAPFFSDGENVRYNDTFMDPITILGAASSAIGIASFGLQLVQILTKYATDAGAAAQNLNATLTNIRAASVSFEYVNQFLKQESERLKLGQKATLSARGIRHIQGVTDDCLKVFWRVEAWVLYKDDSNELELKIANRLNDYKEDVKFDPTRPSQFLKVDETSAKVRKLKESWFARYLSPLQTHKLLQYATELHHLQGSLNLLFTVIGVRLNGPRSGSNSINAMYAAPYDMASRSFEQVVGMRPEATNYMFHPRMNDYETQHLNNRFINPTGRKHLIPVASGIRYVDNPYTHIPQSFFQHSELNQRENTPFRRVVPPAVPDDPLNSVLRMNTAAESSFLQSQDSKGKTNARFNHKSTTGYAIAPGDETIDAAKSYMAHHDAEARLKPEIMSDMGIPVTKTYLDHSMPAEKTRDIDNLSTVAQRSTKASMNVDEESPVEKASRHPDDKVNLQNQKEHEGLNPEISAQFWRPKVSASNNEGIVPSKTFQAQPTNYQVGRRQTSNISKPAMQINDIEVEDQTNDPRNKLGNSVPRHAHILQTKQLQPEISLNLEPNMYVSENRENIPGSFHDNSEVLIDFNDNVTTLQQPSAVFIDEISQARNLSPQAVQYDLLSGDLDELQAGMMAGSENPIIPKSYNTPPMATSDDTVEKVTAKVLAAFAPILSIQTELRGTIDQPNRKEYEQFAIKKEEISESSKAVNLPMKEKFLDKNKSNKSQDKIIPQSRASDASIETSSSPSTNRRSQQNIEINSCKLPKQRKDLLFDDSNPDCSPPSNFGKLPTDYPASQISNSLSDVRCSEVGTSQSSRSNFSKHSFIKSGGLKNIFRRNNLAEDDIDRMIPEGTFLTAFFIKGQSYQQIPTVRNFKLRKSEIERMLSHTPQQDWWKEFCFLESAETASLTQILKPQENYRKALISLKEVKKHSSRLWSRGEKGHIAIIINKPLAHLDMAPDFGLDYRFAPTRVDTKDSSNGNAFGPQQLGELISRAMDDRDCLYGAYTIHPILIETSFQSPDWVNAYGVKQHFSGRHILGRILELSTSSGIVIAKLLNLTVPQQRQVQKIVDSNNEVNSSITWTLAQLEVVYGKCLSPTSDGILSITVYIVGTSNESADNTSRSEKSGWTMSSSSTLKDRGADDIRKTSSLKSVDFTKSLNSPPTTPLEFLTPGTKDTEPIPPNSPKSLRSISSISDTSDVDPSDSERTLGNYYEALQIPTNANAAAIKKAYLSLRKDSHPTSNHLDLSARKRFVTEAYRALGNNPSAKFKRTKSWDENYGERDDVSDDESYNGRLHVSFVESRRMPVRRGIRNPERYESDGHSSSDNEPPQRTHGVGRVPYRRFPQPLAKDRGRNSTYDDRPRHALSRRYYRSRSPPLESSSSDNDSGSLSPLRTSFRGKIPTNSSVRKYTASTPGMNSFSGRGPPRPPLPRSESSFDDSRPPSPERGSLHYYSNRPARSFAERAFVPNRRPSNSPPRRTASVARPVTDSVNWRQRHEPNRKGPQPNNFSGSYNDWSRSRSIQPPSPQPSPRPSSYNLPSHQFIQEPVIPFDRRPAYYPDHYDGKSYNPYGTLRTEYTDDNIVQQLLLEWTPAGEEAEAVAAQNTDKNNRLTANRGLNDTYTTSSRVASQNYQTAQEQVEKPEIPDTTKMNAKGGRRPMATVEDDAGEFSDSGRPSLFPRRAMTSFF
ncbi:uncharacterized protein Bfra_012389 [Botrytis fragariae]|uniref:J domain-containing protein n=1 Tax=Botrytis fragariae TaxID=1964551 RepID=A0A8H6AIP2_9HELO|nr:uncharacterized protein Bfra_012389 [Botrytis fragariae]KAF5868478.1 hypothetical protein Bfra_012389 [Botrytis fragariae]